MKKLIKSVIPSKIYSSIRDLPYYFAGSPPTNINYPIPHLKDQYDGPRGYENYIRSGEEALKFYTESLGVSSTAKLLDIGCGIGRKSAPLVNHIKNSGMYVGVDIDKRGVAWCSNNISPINNRFVFFCLNVQNSFYNPNGRIKPGQVVFPFTDSGFDYVVSWSVFTHMYASDIEHYISEISRVLRKGGKMAASFFVLNQNTQIKISSGKAFEKIVIRCQDGKSWTTNQNIPEDLIAVEEDWLRHVLSEHGLQIEEPIRYGWWRDRSNGDQQTSFSYQDKVIATKL